MVEKDTLIKVIPFLSQLEVKESEALAQIARVRSFEAHSIIHDAHQSCIGVFFVLQGSARAYMLSEEGREITLFRIEEGESCVLSASCVMPLITFDILVEAYEETTLVLIPADYYSALMTRSVSVEAYTYKQATTRFSEVMWVMQQQLFMSFDARLAIFLLDEGVRVGSNRINLTHEEIARNIGSAREVVSRTLKTFASRGLVELHRGGLVIIDKQNLRELT